MDDLSLVPPTLKLKRMTGEDTFFRKWKKMLYGQPFHSSILTRVSAGNEFFHSSHYDLYEIFRIKRMLCFYRK